MPNIKIQFDIYDPRYLTDPNSATCFEAGCETLNEAKKQAKEYGSGNVIVRVVLKQVSGNRYKEFSSQIENCSDNDEDFEDEIKCFSCGGKSIIAPSGLIYECQYCGAETWTSS